MMIQSNNADHTIQIGSKDRTPPPPSLSSCEPSCSLSECISTLDIGGSSRFLEESLSPMIAFPEKTGSGTFAIATREPHTSSGSAPKAFSGTELHKLMKCVRRDYDRLVFFWYYVVGPEWLRGLMMSDCEYSLTNINQVVKLRETLDDYGLGTKDLYEAYHDQLESVSDAQYVFSQVKDYLDSERFFHFKSFAAQFLFTVCKLDLLPYYNGHALPRDFQSWRIVVANHIQHYLLNVMHLNQESFRWVYFNVLCSEQQATRHYTFELSHGIKMYPVMQPIDGVNMYPTKLPIEMHPNTFHLGAPGIGLDMKHRKPIQQLIEFQNHYNQSDLDRKADLQWPRCDQQQSLPQNWGVNIEHGDMGCDAVQWYNASPTQTQSQVQSQSTWYNCNEIETELYHQNHSVMPQILNVDPRCVWPVDGHQLNATPLQMDCMSPVGNSYVSSSSAMSPTECHSWTRGVDGASMWGHYGIPRQY